MADKIWEWLTKHSTEGVPETRPPQPLPFVSGDVLTVVLRKRGDTLTRQMKTSAHDWLPEEAWSGSVRALVDGFEKCIQDNGIEAQCASLYEVLGSQEQWAQAVSQLTGNATRNPVDVRKPIRLRIMTGEVELMRLPWRALTLQGTRLHYRSWRVELVPSELPPVDVRLTNPCRVLVFAPDPEANLEAVHEALLSVSGRYREARFWRVVHTLEHLEHELTAQDPDIFYYHGLIRPGATAAQVLLGTAGNLTPDQLAALFGRPDVANRPSVVYLSAFHGPTGRALYPQGHLWSAYAPLVFSQWSAPSEEDAQRYTAHWFSQVLKSGGSAEKNVHQAPGEHQLEYLWEIGHMISRHNTFHVSSPSVDYPPPIKVLDRHKQCHILTGQVLDLCKPQQQKRSLVLVATATPGNHVHEFEAQAYHELSYHRKTAHIVKVSVTFPKVPKEGDLSRELRDAWKLAVGQKKDESLVQAIDRLAGRKLPGISKVIWVNWGGFGNGKPGLNKPDFESWVNFCFANTRPEKVRDDIVFSHYISYEVRDDSILSEMDKFFVKLKKKMKADWVLNVFDPLGDIESHDIKNYLEDEQKCCFLNYYSREKAANLAEFIFVKSEKRFDRAVDMLERGRNDRWDSLVFEMDRDAEAKIKEGFKGDPVLFDIDDESEF